jgi:hypothetical protein
VSNDPRSDGRLYALGLRSLSFADVQIDTERSSDKSSKWHAALRDGDHRIRLPCVCDYKPDIYYMNEYDCVKIGFLLSS